MARSFFQLSLAKGTTRVARVCIDLSVYSTAQRGAHFNDTHARTLLRRPARRCGTAATPSPAGRAAAPLVALC
jgi:hypothetical protein